jgi:hypothetical protein
MRRVRWAVPLALLPIALAAGPVAADEPNPPPPADRDIDYGQDVQPLLQARCYACHGPEKRESGLRLDRKADGLAGGDRGPAIVPGNSAASRLILYVTGQNEDSVMMPPAGDGEPLSAEEIGVLRAWIDQGAAWPADSGAGSNTREHWSFRPVARPQAPAVRQADWVRNPIDAFVLARLEAEGIEPSPEADRSTVLRRLCLDLTGLPPSPTEVEEFLNDERPDAFQRLVDRLLASPHYGERWGRHWLDQARYADSDGYEKDTARPHAWRWRNWVIDALNRDLPFDQFTVEQLAGDLLPGATLEQRVATGFHRNTLTNREGGVDQEEFRVAATVDRVNTTGTVWLGITIGCAQCHSHKYDPFTQREYYGLFAFFNSEQEADIPAPLPAEAEAFAGAQRAHQEEQARLAAAVAAYERDELPSRQAAWEQTALTSSVEWHALDGTSATSAGGATLTAQEDGSLLVTGANPDTDTYTISATTELAGITAVRLEALPDASLGGQGPGRTPHGNYVLSEIELSATSRADATQTCQPAFATALADFAQGAEMREFPAAAAIDGQPQTGWAVAPQFGQPHVAVFELANDLGYAGGTTLVVTLKQDHGSQHTLGRFRLSVTTAARPVPLTGLPAEMVASLKLPPEQRSDEQRQALADYYRGVDPELARLNAAVAEHATLAPQPSSSAQVLAELPQPRATHVLLRGDFLRPGDPVEPHTPAVLPELKSDLGSTNAEVTGSGTSDFGGHTSAWPSRLDLARWLVRQDNPLTARVAVNRFWARFFGRGLTTTGEDFGTRGEPPSHPELLDWLAAEFMASGWSVKHLHRTIVTSAAYRQSSRLRPELAERDPYNVLLARQGRFRVEAEIVRDLALAASGLMVPRIGGPSVRPPQPAGISELTYADSASWPESQGADRYRRGLYTHFQRTSPYPMLMTFDSPDSNVCAVKRERSNTPLQALTLLNDAVFVECAQALARRIVAERPAGDPGAATEELLRGRLRHGGRLCLGRALSDTELAQLVSLHADLATLAAEQPEAAAALAGSQFPAGVSVPEAAAWVAVARTLLNLDEFVTRE